MIEKMKFLSITGPRGDIDRMVSKYLSRYEIHLENALTELEDVRDLKPYVQTNPYKSLLASAKTYAALVEDADKMTPEEVSLDDAISLVVDIERRMKALDAEKHALSEVMEQKKRSLGSIEPYRSLPADLRTILGFKSLTCRFGRLPTEDFLRLQEYVYEDSDSIFLKCSIDTKYVYGVYFTPKRLSPKIDAIYASMHFERENLPDVYEGTPEQAARALEEELSEAEGKAAEIDRKRSALIEADAGKLLGARNKIKGLSDNFDIRKMAATTDAKSDALASSEKSGTFYILCGWMAEKDAKAFISEVAWDDKVQCVELNHGTKSGKQPPTRLKNPAIFRPYEMYVKMYGLPAYHEMDPTIFVGITYAFIFGVMFGDLGQGLCLLIGGLLLYRFKHAALAGIIAFAGAFSALFGVLFGSVFGFEDVIPALWLRPREHMSVLPGIGSINTIMVTAVVFGMGLILLTMVFHILNAIRQKDRAEILFGTNALTGLVFYGGLVFAIIMIFGGRQIPAVWLLSAVLALALLGMFLKEPLAKLVTGVPGPKIEGGVGMFIVQGFFEMFEVMLSYFSNTLSFVRIGAFAVSHAAMMGVVLQLSGFERGNANWAVVILGNLFVMGMEGLIVGIQVLRLEFYEMFSRFYKGDGRAFVNSLKKQETK
ncbi:MAG: V-type ATP synthase subunit I [Lachnospiraceae bacterium]